MLDNQLLNGSYDKFSYLIGDFPNLSVFRKFGALTAKTLLYSQAELVHLEYELEILSREDRREPGKENIGISWRALNEAPSADGSDLQKQKVAQIREKLDQYHGKLLQVSAINRLSKPAEADIAFLRRWLERRDGGDFFLRGIEAQPWKLQSASDLVVLSDPSTRDPFGEYLSKKIVPQYHKWIGHRQKQSISGKGWDAIWNYEAEAFVCLGNVLCMLLSSLIPTVSIFSLYLVKDVVARLAIITITSFLFSFILTFVVGAHRVDVFAATTAFAAVQAAFVGGVDNFTLP